jgi:hypothetical protein
MKMAKILEIEELQKAQAYLTSKASIFVILIAQKISYIRRMLMLILGLRPFSSNSTAKSGFNSLLRKPYLC